MNEWINVKDRMPEKDGRYLVVESILYSWVCVCSLRNGKWDSDNISYWMPLPESPK